MLTPSNSPNHRDHRRVDDDNRSVDLLADTPPPKGAAAAMADEDQNVAAASPAVSPATQTLNQLSQPTTDLHYDMSQLDYDVARILQHGVNQDHGTTPSLKEEDSSKTDPPRAPPHPSAISRLAEAPPGTAGRDKTSPVDPARRSDDTETSNATATASTKPASRSPTDAAVVAAPAATEPFPSSQASVSSQRSARFAWTVEQYDLETGETIATWPSLRTVARQFNMVRHHLKACLQGQRDSVQGFGWRMTGTPPPRRPRTRPAAPPKPRPRKASPRKPKPKPAAAPQQQLPHPGPKTRKRKTSEDGQKQESSSKRTRRQSESPSSDEGKSSSSPLGTTRSSAGGTRGTTTSRGILAVSSAAAAALHKKKPSPVRARQKPVRFRRASDLASVHSVASSSTYQSARGPHGQHIQQINLKTGRVMATFKSLREAEREACFNRKEITKVLMGEQTESQGFGWRVAATTETEAPEKGGAKSKNKTATETGKAKRQSLSTKKTTGGKRTTMKDPPTQNIQIDEGAERLAAAKPKKKKKQASGAQKKTIGGKRATKKNTPAPEVVKTEALTAEPTSQIDKQSIGDYRILRYPIIDQGKIGFQIVSCDTPHELKAALESQDGRSGNSDKCAMIGEVKPDGLAQQVGLRPGDCFVEEDRSTPGTIVLCGFDEVRSYGRTLERPLVFFVARRKVGFGELVSKALAQHPGVLSTSEQATNTKEKHDSDAAAGMGSMETLKDEIQHPFCIKCSGKNVRAHHPWCPKHDQFEISGADEILEHLKQGMAINCKLCLEEYTAGRTMKGIHRYGCPRRLLEGKPSPSKVHEEKQPKTDKSAKNNIYKVSAKGRQIRPTDKVLDTAAAIASLAGCDDDSDVSEFDAPDEPKTLPLKSEIIATKAKKNGVSKEVQFKKQSTEGPARGGTNKKKTAPANKSDEKKTGKKKSADHAISARGDDDGRQSTTHAARSESSDSEDEAGDMTWSTTDNPWGPGSYQDGDVVVFAPQLPFEQQEAAFLSERFVHEPFSTYSRYGKSHTPPEEGHHTLVLKRDVMRQSPWGFSVYRHEFGGACLVQSVTPMSPADTASLAGSALTYGLAVNDMILTINQKETAGMTMIAFDLELQLSASSLLLTVSRYKSPKRVIECQLRKEQEDLSKLNDTSNEEQHLGWIDFACGEGGIEYPIDISVASDGSNSVSRLGDGSQTEGNEPFLGPSDEISCVPRARNADATIEKRSTKGPRSPRQSTAAPSAFKHMKDGPMATSSVSRHETGSVESPKPEKQSSPSRWKSTTPRLSNRTVDVASLAVVERTMSNNENRLGSVVDNSKSSSAVEEEWSDDGNAWLGCVCGIVHDEETKVFWIQCDNCKSWYSVAEKCAGLTKKDAPDVEEWLCWACGPAHDSASNAGASDPWEGRPKGVVPQAYQQQPAKHAEDTASTHGMSNTSAVDAAQRDPSAPRFKEDDLVYVTEHAWPGVNTSAGIAKVLAACTDADGNAVYDVKYIVGGTKKGIFEKYLSRHCF